MVDFRLNMMSAAAAALMLGGSASGALAQSPAPSGAPPSWETLLRCAEIGDDREELDCYRAAMRASGYAPSQASAAERRRRFGLPPINPFRRDKDDERPPAVAQAQPGPAGSPQASAPLPAPEETQVTVRLETVAFVPPNNRLLLITADGAIWEQSDNETVSPWPKAGATMTIRATPFGGFFCDFDKRTRVRCKRRR